MTAPRLPTSPACFVPHFCACRACEPKRGSCLLTFSSWKALCKLIFSSDVYMSRSHALRSPWWAENRSYLIVKRWVYHLCVKACIVSGRNYSCIFLSLFCPPINMVGITKARSSFMFMTCISLRSSLGSEPGRVWLDGSWKGGVGAGEWNEWVGVKAPVPLCSICLNNCPLICGLAMVDNFLWERQLCLFIRHVWAKPNIRQRGSFDL